MERPLLSHGFTTVAHILQVISFLCMLVALATAQTSTTGKIVGTVTDPSGAVVPKAQITLQNLATNATSTVTSNEAGNFKYFCQVRGHLWLGMVGDLTVQDVKNPTVTAAMTTTAADTTRGA